MVDCPLCATSNETPAFRVREFSYHRCRHCAALFVDIRLSKAAIHDYYSEDYYESESSTAAGRRGYPSYRDTRNTLTDGFHQKLALVKRYVASGKILDIGAAYGFFLNVASHSFVGEGVEVSPYAAHVARTEFNADVEVGDAEHLKKPSASFDAVTMWDIIEHLPDPCAALQEVNRVLVPGGYLFISTDDAANWLPRLLGRRWWAFGPPMHLCHISKKGLTIACSRAGLEEPLYLSDPRVYTVPEVVKHFGVSYENPLLNRSGAFLEKTFLKRVRLRIARPEQFIAVVRKPS